MLHLFVSMHIRKVLEQKHMLSDLKTAAGITCVDSVCYIR